MAKFETTVCKLQIIDHPNADNLEIAVVGEYNAIVPKGQFKTGDYGVYIPEGAIVPDWLLKEMNLFGRLAGKDKNRVKAIKLRGVLSQGLVYPISSLCVNGEPRYTLAGESGVDMTSPSQNDFLDVSEGDNVADFLGIIKYEPPIPSHMNGDVFNAHGYTLHYDIENFKKYPNVLKENEEVVMTEKTHGTWCCLGYHPDVKHPIVTSKGLSSKGLAFKLNKNNENNLYVQTLMSTVDETGDDVVTRYRRSHPELVPFYILGEIFGEGVQDLTYGFKEKQFRVFDVYKGAPGQGRYLNFDELISFCNEMNLEMVPLLYRGPFSYEKMVDLTDGPTTFNNGIHIREGVVVKPTIERTDLELGRVQLKSVSEKYLLRKGDVTEYN